jgi:hypothetical protein
MKADKISLSVNKSGSGSQVLTMKGQVMADTAQIGGTAGSPDKPGYTQVNPDQAQSPTNVLPTMPTATRFL